MDSHRQNSHDLSARGTFHEKCRNNRKDARFKKGFTQGTGLGYADADVFINRAGKSLIAERRAELEKAKTLLSQRVHRESQGRRRKAGR